MKNKTVIIYAGRVFVLAALAVSVSFTVGCKRFTADIEEDFSYRLSGAFIVSAYLAERPLTDDFGIQSIASNGGKTVTFTIRNPKKYTFRIPASLGASDDIFVFEDSVKSGNSGNLKPKPEDDYQVNPTTVRLKYKASFLQKTEWGESNIFPSVNLYSTDGGKFTQTCKFNLKVNTAPPELTFEGCFKTANERLFLQNGYNSKQSSKSNLRM